LGYVIVRIVEVQGQFSNLLILAKLQPCKAQILNRTYSLGVEEINFVDVNLIVYSVDKGRVYGILKISERFEVGNLFESDYVIVKEVYSSSYPSFEANDSDSYGRSIDSSEVDSCHVLSNC